MKLLLVCAGAAALAACSGTTTGAGGAAEMAADATPTDGFLLSQIDLELREREEAQGDGYVVNERDDRRDAGPGWR